MYAPKATVTKNFDKLSRKFCKNVEYFVVFSSTVGCYGGELQSNYGYANVVADKLCEKRVEMGFHALTLRLGVVSDVGYVADKLFKGRDVSPDFNQFCKPQSITSVLETLEQVLLLGKRTISCFVPHRISTDEGGKGASLVDRVLKIMGAGGEKIHDEAVKLKELGIDSLSSSMIRQILQRDYKTKKNVSEISNLSVRDIMEIENEHRTSESIFGCTSHENREDSLK